MTFPYTFPFTFPGSTQASAPLRRIPVPGWWADLYGTCHVNVTPTVAAHLAHLNLASANVTPTVMATGFLTVSKAVAVTVTPTVVVTGHLTVSGTAAVTVTPSVSATGHLGGVGSASVNVTPTVTATGKASGTSAVTVTPTVTATGHPTFSGASATTVTPTVTATGHLTFSGTVAVNVTPTVSATLAPTVVTFDAVGAGTAAASTTWSWAHTISGNGIVVFLCIIGTPGPTITAKVGTTSMTLLGDVEYYVAIDGYVYAFGLLSPPTGAQTINITSSASGDLVGSSLSYNNVTGFGTAVTNSDSSGSTSPTVTVTSATGQMAAVASGGLTTTFTSFNKTPRANVAYSAGVNVSFVMGDAAGASSLTFTAAGAQPWGSLAVPVQ